MCKTLRILAVIIALQAGRSATLPVIPGDSTRGAALFETERCIQCHSVNGRGGKVGVDLGRTVPRNYSPAFLASTMWNHAPVMWAAMEGAGMQKPQLTPEGAADLFAFFYSSRFFEKPGDTARGRDLFDAKHCAACHGISES